VSDDAIGDDDQRVAGLHEMCRLLDETEPGPYLTRLVDISNPEGSQLIEAYSKTHRSVLDAVRSMRTRERWTKDMGVGPFLRPEVQAQVLNASGAVILRLVALEAQTVKTITMFGVRVAGPYLQRAELEWVPVTEEAGRGLLRLAAAQAERKSKGEG
jgi:hypothetical protein